MGIQCHVKLADILPVLFSIEISREHYTTGGGTNQDEPWDYYTCEVTLPGRTMKLYGNMDDDMQGFWFDANHWGSNRWQVEALREFNVPFLEG